MRKGGFIIFAVGLFVTLVTGFNFVTKEKFVDTGHSHIEHSTEIQEGNAADMNRSSDWSPSTGIVVMVIGGVLILIAGKEH